MAAYMFFHGGGIGRYTHEWLTALRRAGGVEARLLATPEFHWQEHDRYPIWTGLRSISHPVPVRRRARFLAGQVVNPLRAVQQVQADEVLHLSNINHLTYPLWRAIARRRGVLVTATAHDVHRRVAILHRGWETRQLRRFYQEAAALFVHSVYQKRAVLAYADVDPARVHVVPHGPYAYAAPTADRAHVRRRLGLPDEGQVALLFGQLRADKNLEGLLNAIAQVARPLHLVVAGKGHDRHDRGVEDYRALATRLGVADRVRFLHRFIEDCEVADLFTAADWVAIPYRRQFTSQSGVLNVAAHYRRPVLVSSAPVLKETVEAVDIGVAADGDDPEALAEGLGRLMDRIEGGAPFAFDAYAQTYSWAENARRTAAVYRSLLAHR